MKLFQSIDNAGARWASRQGTRFAPLYRLAYALGSPVVTVLILGSIAAWGAYTKDQAFFQAALIYLLVLAVGIGLKYLIARPRPAEYHKTHKRVSTASFPSGHSLGSVLAFQLIAQLVWYYADSPLISWFVAALAVGAMIVVGLSRVYRGHHYLTDVLGGWLIGVVTVILTFLFAFQ